MSIEIALLISIVSVSFSIFFGLKNSKRTDENDIEARVRDNTQINMKLDEISRNVTDIRNDVSSLRKDINSHNERLIKVEESCKSAHHRLNMLENRVIGDNGE